MKPRALRAAAMAVAVLVVCSGVYAQNYPQNPGPHRGEVTYPYFPDGKGASGHTFQRLPKFFTNYPTNPKGEEADPGQIVQEGPMPIDLGVDGASIAAPRQFRTWEGIRRFDQAGGSQYIPPDPHVAVGPTRVMTAVNDHINIYDKDGNAIADFDSNTFFGLGDLVFDPKVAYDPWRSRYIVLFLRTNASTSFTRLLIAVTRAGSLPTANTGDWWIYNFDMGNWGGNSLDTWADYPQLGFDDNAVYVTTRCFATAGGGLNTGRFTILNKDQVYSGLGAGRYDYWNMSSNGTLDYYIMPTMMWSVAATHYSYITKHNAATNSLTTRRITWPTGVTWTEQWANGPSLATEVDTIASYTNPPNAPQPGLQALDTIDTRLLSGTHSGNISYLTFNERFDWGGGNIQSVVRLVIVNPSSGNTAVNHDTRLGSSAASYFYPGGANTTDGDFILSFAYSGTGTNVQMRRVGVRSGAAGNDGSATVRSSAVNYQVLDTFSRNRWGDYFGAARDPFDNRTVWLFGQYAVSQTNWGTFIAETNYKDRTTTTVDAKAGVIGQTISLTCTVNNIDTPGAASGMTVEFFVNNVSAGTATTNASGIATRSYTIPESLGVGNRTIRCETANSTSLNGSTGTNTLTVSKSNTSLTGANVAGSFGQVVNLVATLRRTSDNDLLSGKTVRFLRSGVLLGTAVTNASGVATRAQEILDTWTVGANTITLEFQGDALYNADTGSLTLTANKANTTTTPSNVAGQYGQTVNLTATLRRTTDNAVLSGKTVNFTVAGVNAGSAVTNGFGVASRSYTIPESLPLGANTINAAFAGDTPYNASNGNSTLTAQQAPTSTSPDNTGGQIGSTVPLTATLLRTTDNAPLAGRTVSFTVNGANAGSGVTDGTGEATVNYVIPELAVGNYAIVASFAGEAKHAASNGNANLRVLAADTTVTVSNVNGRRGATVNLTATLRNANNTAVLSGKTLTFFVGGVNVGNAVTNASGVATRSYVIPTGLALGAHAINVQFAGDAMYNPSNGNGTLNVLRVRLVGTVDTQDYSLNEAGLTAVLTVRQGGGVQIINVVLGANGTYSTETDLAGAGATISAVIQSGTWLRQRQNVANLASTVTTNFSLINGDVNGDGIIDDADLATVLANFGLAVAIGDVNGDGLVDDNDLAVVLTNFGLVSDPS